MLCLTLIYGASKFLTFTAGTAQRQPDGDRSRGLYELSRDGSIIVLFLFLIPFNLLMNENFDLHERSWVNFNNWRDANTVRLEYLESRKSQQRFYDPRESLELSSHDGFSEWLKLNSRYMYLPCTYLVGQGGKEIAGSCYEGIEGRLADPERRQEYRRVVQLVDTTAGESHEHYWDSLEKHENYGLGKEKHYLSTLLLVIPRFSEMGSVLLQTTGEKNAWLEEWRPCTVDERLCTVIALPGINAAFSVTQYFPHTRSSDPLAFVVNVVLLLGLAFLVLVLCRVSLPMLIPNLTHNCTPTNDQPPESGSAETTLYRKKALVLANLAYFGLANPRNTDALDPLLKDGTIVENRLGYELTNSEDTARIKQEMTKDDLLKAARAEGQGAWQHVKAPLILLMFGALFFTVYAAQDEFTSVLQIVGSISALLVTARSVVENFK